VDESIKRAGFYERKTAEARAKEDGMKDLEACQTILLVASMGSYGEDRQRGPLGLRTDTAAHSIFIPAWCPQYRRAANCHAHPETASAGDPRGRGPQPGSAPREALDASTAASKLRMCRTSH
jgi:hypothetical protein